MSPTNLCPGSGSGRTQYLQSCTVGAPAPLCTPSVGDPRRPSADFLRNMFCTSSVLSIGIIHSDIRGQGIVDSFAKLMQPTSRPICFCNSSALSFRFTNSDKRGQGIVDSIAKPSHFPAVVPPSTFRIKATPWQPFRGPGILFPQVSVRLPRFIDGKGGSSEREGNIDKDCAR